MSPTSLGIAAAAALLLAILLLPPARRALARRRLATERRRVEDALKHLHHAEYEGRAGSVESVAGALGVSRERALGLLGRVEAAGLVRAEGSSFVLTEDGRAWALRVVRNHRLWERYLAERTGVHPGEWHARAERREHTLTEDESDRLSASLGHPRYDPHGDPIPAADGSLPPATGVPLGMLSPGAVATIVHVEDEPPRLYDRLVAAGLGPGTRVEVLGREDGALRIRASGREHTLEPVVVANVAVQPLHDAPREDDVETLDALGPGDRGRVVRVAAACQGPARQRLLDLGVVPGTVIEARYAGVAGDPVAYEIRGALIGLRRSQAAHVLVRRVAPEGAGPAADDGAAA